jgi:DNA-directed RNA polymerase specialized sigma24 family protein
MAGWLSEMSVVRVKAEVKVVAEADGGDGGGVRGVRGVSGVDRPDPDAFEDVYRATYTRLLRAAHMMSGSNETAEEVVQDAFVQLYPRFATVRDPAGYLYRSVVHGCRARHRRRLVLDRLRPPLPPRDVGPPEIDETWAVLRGLSSRQRAVVVLRFYADLPLADIAQALDCPIGTVKSLLHRALAQLKEVLGR